MLKRCWNWLFRDDGTSEVDRALGALIRLYQENTKETDALMCFTAQATPIKIFVVGGQFASYLEAAAFDARDRMVEGGGKITEDYKPAGERRFHRRNPSRRRGAPLSDAELIELRKMVGLGSDLPKDSSNG